ncbi:hypothetical protein [Bradyrhizobium sp. URHD0069]|jgi:hypothetical protein|nr:hypothetical protein [Bradyrhizobium sp. URHD0069]
MTLFPGSNSDRPFHFLSSGLILNWLVAEKGTAPHTPVIDKSKKIAPL